jgi:predicted DNA-binding protein (UPF0251 family)
MVTSNTQDIVDWWEMEEKPRKKQVQPKKHVGKTKAVVEARRKKIVKAVVEGKTIRQAGMVRETI